MKTNQRNYNCKDIEFLVIVGYTIMSFLRDILFFTKFSKKFTPVYGAELEADLVTAKDLVEPLSEMVEQKAITDRMHACMDGLSESLNWIKGYIDMAGSAMTISIQDFGITDTRKAINTSDIEGVLKGMHTINTNIVKYKVQLVEQGLSEELEQSLIADAASIESDRLRQYTISTNRKTILQDNVEFLNELYTKISEIHRVGKILFKGSDPVKLQEYTYADLVKKVRRVSKPDTEVPAV